MKRTQKPAPEQPPLAELRMEAMAIESALYGRLAALVDDDLGDQGNTSAIEEAISILHLMWMVANARRTKTPRFVIELTGMPL